MCEGVRNIGKYAFFGCTSLKKIIIPKSVEALGDYSLGYIANNGEAEKLDGFSMSVYSDSAAGKYAKKSGLEFTVVDKSIAGMAFIIIGAGVVLAAAVIAVVLMKRGGKGSSAAAKKLEEAEEEKNYKSILSDSDNE